MHSNHFAQKHYKLIKILAENQLDALALNAGPNLTHLTGLHFHLMERPVVGFFPRDGKPLFVLPELEQAKLAELPFDFQAFPYSEDRESWPKAFQQAVKAGGLDAKKIGVIARRMRVLELRFLQGAAPQAEFIPAEEAVAELRMRKNAQEIASMQNAAQCAQLALQNTLAGMKIGMTERQFAAELTSQLLRGGSDPELPFSPIVASGPNSANPHATPTDRKLSEGDLLLVDWGASVDEYFSDITRTFAIGEVSAQMKQIAGVVAQANAAGRIIAKPGVSAGDVDHAVREVISQAGYGEFFTHRTGHGLGREGHEEPYISAGNKLILEVGMTFTIEPGIYIPQVGGVRIEDDMVITPQGCESLTDLPRELIKVGDL
ncbi:MAG: peptidase M24 [Anaerolineaceae bacterium 4572_5.1]|nr:MAG: peptidase M24 [Anaerolineaceae bacterium 4572_5.1]RLD09483.1 MAG: aminopeptidase P family protein [Chloroflexota bacterium]